MKHLVFILMLEFLHLLPSQPVCAEMYRYKDASGVVRFTDNLADVPEKQRAGVAVYENAPSPSAPEQPSGRDTPSRPNLEITEKLSGDSAADFPQSDELSNDPSRIDQLLKIKIALDEENVQIVKASLTLSEEKKTLSGNDAIRAYNEKVSAQNSRVHDYERRRLAFQKEADAFDAGLKKRPAPPPLTPQPTSP